MHSFESELQPIKLNKSKMIYFWGSEMKIQCIDYVVITLFINVINLNTSIYINVLDNHKLNQFT